MFFRKSGKAQEVALHIGAELRQMLRIVIHDKSRDKEEKNQQTNKDPAGLRQHGRVGRFF